MEEHRAALREVAAGMRSDQSMVFGALNETDTVCGVAPFFDARHLSSADFALYEPARVALADMLGLERRVNVQAIYTADPRQPLVRFLTPPADASLR